MVDGEERPEQGGREVIKIRFGGEFMNASGINPSHFCQLLVGQRGPPFTLAFCSLFPGFGATVPTALSEPLKELQPHPHPAPSGQTNTSFFFFFFFLRGTFFFLHLPGATHILAHLYGPTSRHTSYAYFSHTIIQSVDSLLGGSGVLSRASSPFLLFPWLPKAWPGLTDR